MDPFKGPYYNYSRSLMDPFKRTLMDPFKGALMDPFKGTVSAAWNSRGFLILGLPVETEAAVRFCLCRCLGLWA